MLITFRNAEWQGVFHEENTPIKLIDETPSLDWLLLTKRPENIIEMWPDDRHRSNVWLGCSVENQEYAGSGR